MKVLKLLCVLVFISFLSSSSQVKVKRQAKPKLRDCGALASNRCHNMDLSTFCVVGNKLRRVLYDEKHQSMKYERYAHLQKLLTIFYPPYRDTSKVSKAPLEIANAKAEVSITIDSTGDKISRQELLPYYIWCNDQSCDTFAPGGNMEGPLEYPAKFNWYTVNDNCNLGKLASNIFPVEKIEDKGVQGVLIELAKNPTDRCEYYAKNTDNPFSIETTEITIDGRKLVNHLHFAIKYKKPDPNKCFFPGSKGNGIEAAFVVVHDQNGWPIGDFNTGVPCGYDCGGDCNPYPHNPARTPKCHQAEEKDTFPCSYIFEDTVTHPGQFMKYFEKPVEEIHATWRFAQSTFLRSFVTEIHVKSFLVLKDANNLDDGNYASFKEKDPKDPTKPRNGFNYFYSESEPKKVTNLFTIQRESDKKEFANSGSLKTKFKNCQDCPTFAAKIGLYGWNAKYNILWPKNTTIGAWDWVPKGYIDPSTVKCHVPIDTDYYHSERYPDSADYNYYTRFFGSREDLAKLLSEDDPVLDPYEDFFHGVLKRDDLVKLYSVDRPDNHKKKIEIPICYDRLTSQKKLKDTKGLPTHNVLIELTKLRGLEEMEDEERCRCPKFGTDKPDPRYRVPPVSQLEGRRDHALQMIIAWTLLVPFAMFVSRYFKETFNKVFFLQEYWWYTMHVLTLVLAFVFMIGGIFAIEIKRAKPGSFAINWDDENQVIHAGVGCVSLILFTLQILSGSFRYQNVARRRIQITLHWLCGVLEYLFAVFAMCWASLIQSGCMSCSTFFIMMAWVIVQLAFYLVMEIHIRKVDADIGLEPPRSYLPPPIMRLFHRDAPGARFRIYVLVLFFTTCGIFYVVQHITLMTGTPFRSCFNYDVDLEERQANYLIDT